MVQSSRRLSASYDSCRGSNPYAPRCATSSLGELHSLSLVYALYSHWRFIKPFLAFLWILENALMLWSFLYALSRVNYDEANCVIILLPREFSWFACVHAQQHI
jgi:hypothetical protein